jgi:ferredoxin
VPTCPVEAIYADDELPAEWAHYGEWNAYLSEQWRALGYNITEKKPPLAESEDCKDQPKTEEDILTWEGAE